MSTAGADGASAGTRGAPIPEDRILLSGLRVRGHHGVLPHEAQLGQVFEVDLELALDLAPAGRADDLNLTVDYGSLAGRVAEVVGGRPRKLLEAVAEDVAQLVLADERVRMVRVRVTKPQAPLPVDASVAVEITRDRERTGEGRA
jgi:7,8-dihydroneopterin aldolase/epimerase/oxygenase